MKILYLIPRLDYHGTAKQLALLAKALPQPAYQPFVCVIKETGPLVEPLLNAGIPVEILGWRRRFDLQPLFRLRDVLQRVQPDVVHACQPLALRLLRLVGKGKPSKCVLSAPFSGG